MDHIFTGKLFSYIFRKCNEPRSNLKLRPYKIPQKNTIALAVDNPISADDKITGEAEKIQLLS